MRCALGSKPSLRPASWIGWKVTPRTQRLGSAWRTMSAISSSLTPFFTVTTRVVEMLCAPAPPAPGGGCADRSAPRRFHQRVALQAVELQIDLEARHVVRPAARRKPGSRAMRRPLVLIIRWRIGRRLRGVEDLEELRDGWWARRRRSAPGPARPRRRPARRACARSRPAAGARSRFGEESAKQTGQERLQASLTSMIARQECCSWSGQRPQS